ncbi:hypothetical protein KCV87_07085 [Actinosynnema pretiosum subsp. pretiosum]|uniref:Uncharacterized protein n=2 Tax=Actinosynnema TaxID=40566 RepID=C6WMJ8_ACTMD|nr:hypothetical protein [Actinosynnema mirum]ACU36527.1 hypothetical protein Amir_2590 [Actinosynnema mirum DSM 43827]AXX29980.1 hypothetical protein APASM_2615 [Actinosynnema pretiosum subsp. pretiosum]QUF05836.1 hypothetical protein KCV87_07085 [Actinosynnema pretiosum subsp. pretiosum]
MSAQPVDIAVPAPRGGAAPIPLNLTVPSEPNLLPCARAALDRWLAAAGIDPGALVRATGELADDLAGRGRVVLVRIAAELAGDRVVIHVGEHRIGAGTTDFATVIRQR